MGSFPDVTSISCFFIKVEKVAYKSADINPESWRISKTLCFM